MYLQTKPSGVTSGIDFNNEDQLYQLAQMQGGAVAEAANELAHPNTGILSTVGNGFKNAFKTFIDTISIPSEIVAGAISSTETIGSAIDKHLSVDQAIFGDTNIFGNEDGTQTTMQKVGGFIVRAAPDILLDPLTWVTGGAGNLSKVGILSKEGLAARDIVRAELANSTHDIPSLEKAIRNVGADGGLSGAKLDAFVADKIAKGDLNDYIKNSYEQIRMRDMESLSDMPFAEIKTLSPEGQAKALKYAKAQKLGMQNTFWKEEATAMMEHTGSTYDEALAKVEDMVKTKQYDQEFLKMTLDAPLDMPKALEAVGNWISRKPHLIDTLISKGGIRFMGQTILEGQRITKAIEAIPMMHQIETYTKEWRGKIFALSPTGKEYSNLERVYADLSKSKKNDAIREVINIFKENKITGAEANFITSAIEYGRMPIDEQAKALFLNAHGIDYESMFNNPRLVQAIRGVKNMNEINYQEAIARGIAVSRKDNYMMHLVPLENLVQKSFSNISPSATLSASKNATVLKFVNTESGELLFSNGKYVGQAEHFKLKQFDPIMEQKTLLDTLDALQKKTDIHVQELQTEHIELADTVNSFFRDKSLEDLRGYISKINNGKGIDIESALRVFKGSLPELDVNGMKLKRIEAKKLLDEGLNKITAGGGGQEGLILKQALVDQLENEIKNLDSLVPSPETVTALRSYIESGRNIFKKRKPSGGTAGVMTEEDKALNDALNIQLENLTKLKAEYKTTLLKNSIDTDALSNMTNQMLTEFENNPIGVNHLLNAMIGKDNKISKLLLEMSDKRLAIMKEVEKNGEHALVDGKLFRSSSGEIYRAERPAIIEAEANGIHFEPNALAIMFRASLDTTKATISRDFISDVAMKFGRLESQAPDQWREVSVSGLKDAPKNLSNYLIGKRGEKILFHPDVAKRIENFHASVINDEDINAILKKYDQLTTIFKASVTSVFPAFHGRNAISNVMNSFLDIGYAALNPARHVMSGQIVKSSYRINALQARIAAGDLTAHAELYREMGKDAFTDSNGYTWSMGQLHRILKDKNIALGNQFSGRTDVAAHRSVDDLPQLMVQMFSDPNEKLGAKTLRKSKEGIIQVSQTGQQFGQLIEDHSRIVHFLENLDRTGDVGLSAERTKMFLFDYGDLSNFERTYLKRIFPFYTWIKKNIELQAKVMASSPGRISQEVHVFNTLSSAMTNGQGLTDEEYDMLPEYMKNQFNIVTSRNGNKLHVLSNFGGPLEAAFNAIQPKNILTAANPLFMVPAQLTTGYDIFRGGMMSDTNNAKLLKDAPQAVKDAVGFVHYQYKDKNTNKWVDRYSALNPKMFFFIMNQPFGSRIFNQWMHEKKVLSEGTANSVEENIKNTFGVSSSDLDLEDMSNRAYKTKVKELQTLLEEAGVISRLNKPFKSKNSRVVQ